MSNNDDWKFDNIRIFQITLQSLISFSNEVSALNFKYVNFLEKINKKVWSMYNVSTINSKQIGLLRKTCIQHATTNQVCLNNL